MFENSLDTYAKVFRGCPVRNSLEIAYMLGLTDVSRIRSKYQAYPHVLAGDSEGITVPSVLTAT